MRTITGYAATFNTLSADLGGFREKIAPGAFARALKSSDIRALFNHDPNLILGRLQSGTLRLAEDRIGLTVEIDPPEASWAEDLVTLIGRGDVREMSFSFRKATDRWDYDAYGTPIRTLVELHDLFDVSVVTYPAYPGTSANVRGRRP